jgi:antitoxin component YwqK of YwqJK toxin-antitoxin module
MKEKLQRSNNLRQDTARSWYDNGQLEYWAFFKNGKEQGVSEWYYRNGKRMSKGLFLNGKLDGDVYHWDSLGRVTFITTYRIGELINER